MSKDKSRPKAGERSAPPTPDADDDSLDFSHIGPAQSPPSTKRSARKKAASPDPQKADSSRKVPVAILIIVAIVLIVAVATHERSSNGPVTTTSPSATRAAPSYQGSPTPNAPQAQTPPGSAPQAVNARPLPAEFLKAFQDYTAKSGGNKAIALALDSDGRSAYVSVAGYPAQSQASEEALSECTRFKVQSGVKENCRLYAEGDKVVW